MDAFRGVADIMAPMESVAAVINDIPAQPDGWLHAPRPGFLNFKAPCRGTLCRGRETCFRRELLRICRMPGGTVLRGDRNFLDIDKGRTFLNIEDICRLSLGIEDADDIIDDLNTALMKVP